MLSSKAIQNIVIHNLVSWSPWFRKSEGYLTVLMAVQPPFTDHWHSHHLLAVGTAINNSPLAWPQSTEPWHGHNYQPLGKTPSIDHRQSLAMDQWLSIQVQNYRLSIIILKFIVWERQKRGWQLGTKSLGKLICPSQNLESWEGRLISRPGQLWKFPPIGPYDNQHCLPNFPSLFFLPNCCP